MLTSSPLVESWGHFPASRRRLLALLRAVHPPTALILSGDVHYAELLGGSPRATDSPAVPGAGSAPTSRDPTLPSGARLPTGANVVEVTSSGLTHSCGGAHGTLCSLALRLFSSHRAMPEPGPEPVEQTPSSLLSPPPGSSVQVNFGTLRFYWDAVNSGSARRPASPHVHMQVHGVDGQTAFSQRLPIGMSAELESARWQAALDMATIFDGAICLRAPAVVLAAALVLLPICFRRTCRRAPRRQQQQRLKPPSGNPSQQTCLGDTALHAASRRASRQKVA